MELKDILSTDDKLRIIQELVPGKQITLAHVIASPDPILYTKLGLNPEIDFGRSAIGILTMSPAETAIIAADLATKTSNVDLSFVDRFSGTLIITVWLRTLKRHFVQLWTMPKGLLNLLFAR